MARMHAAFYLLTLVVLVLQLLVLCALLPQAVMLRTLPGYGGVAANLQHKDPRPSNDSKHDLSGQFESDSAPWEYDMIEEAVSILPWELDILLTDVNTPVLRGSISHLLGYEYLAPWPSNVTMVWPLRGIVHGGNSRLMVSAATSLSPEKARSNEVDSKLIVVHYLLDTGSPYTYLSEEAVKSLSNKRFYYDSYDTLPVHIHGVPIEVHVSPSKSHFKEVCLLGADYMKAIQGEVHAFYGGKKSFTIVKGSSLSIISP